MGLKRGDKHTKGAKKKISENHADIVGNKNPFYGKKHTKESIEKIRKSRKYIIFSQKTKNKISCSLKGEKNPNWRGGITKTTEKIRIKREYKIWRKAVLERDGWICQKCMEGDGILNAHHVLNFISHPKLRLDINNGITLHQECHIEFHTLYGTKNNTKEQLKQWLGSSLGFRGP